MALNPNYGYGTGGFGVGLFGSAPIVVLPSGYYRSIITSQYRQSTRFLAWLDTVLQLVDDAQQFAAYIDVAMDIDVAAGVQLDMLGQSLGAGRLVGFQPSNSVSPLLDDATYRLLLKSRIYWNTWDGTANSLQSIWQALFPGGMIIVQDAQNMTANIILTGNFTSIIQDLITHGLIVPRPAGVLYNYVFGTLPVFGLDQNTEYVAGVDQGHLA